MKNKVKYSSYSIAITIIILILSIAGVISLWHDNNKLVLFCLIMGAIIISGLFFCPVSVEANDKEIRLYRLLAKPKVFAYNDIQAVEVCYPSFIGMRLCASGGCFGHWGYFNDVVIGTYFGYYGSRSYCFLVKLKNGRQYVLGCEDPVAMANCIGSHMRQNPRGNTAGGR